MNTLYNKEKPKLKKKRRKFIDWQRSDRLWLMDSFTSLLTVVWPNAIPIYTFIQETPRVWWSRERKKKGPISKEKTNTHSKKPHDLSNWAIYLDHHGVIQCISEAWNETYQRGVEGWRVCPQGHVALGAVGTGTVDGVCEGRDPGVGAEQTRPVLAGTHRLSRVGVRHYGPTILTTWGGRWR